jgi:tetratricopeptide (TPR) repeat protein
MAVRRNWTIAGFMALAVLVGLAYSNHFQNSFHFDDSHTIIENAYIRDLHNIGRIFTDTTAFSSMPANRAYRPLVTASLALDYAIGGGLKPFYFHASTFFWFVVQILLMYVLFRKVCDVGRPDPRNPFVALAAAAIYGIHPAIAETVNYIIQRGDIYSTIGVIAGMVLYAVLPAYRRTGLYLVPVVLALLSKPPALVFPAILFVYVRLFEETQFVPSLKKCIPALLVIGAAGYLLASMTPSTFTPMIGSTYSYRITQPLVALRYFGSFFLPNHLTADTDFIAVNSIFERGAWLGYVFVVAMSAVAVWCSRRREWRPAAFGLWWFLIALVPTSIFALSEVENDHRMYFPFVGLMLAVCWAVALVVYRQARVGRMLAFAGPWALILLFSVMVWATRERNEVWRTDESLWLDVTIKSPKNGRGLMNYGLTQMEKGDYRRALDYFEKAEIFTPAYAFLQVNLGIANGGLNQDTAAERHFQQAIALAPNLAESHYFYGRWLRQKNRLIGAIAESELAVQVNADYLPARYLVMQIYSDQGDRSKLRAAAENMLQRFPSDSTAARFLAQANSPNGIPTATLAAGARTADDYINMSLMYYRARKFDDSIKASQEALKLQPNYAAAYNNIAAAYAELHDWDHAIAAANEALRIQPDFQLARNNLAWAESQKKVEDERRR